MARVSVIVGSQSDGAKGREAIAVLEKFGVDSHFKILSAHRKPKELDDYISKSKADVFIAIAGLSAALPGYIASRTLKPVIGVPRDVKMGGLDALLSIVQMPSGIPVACVGIDNAKNAAILAIEILAQSDEKLRRRLKDFRDRGAKL